MFDCSSRFLGELSPDAKFALMDYLGNSVGNVRFFSYGSNMNKKKFEEDMRQAADKLQLPLKDKTKLCLDPSAIKRSLRHFRRELSNESQSGRAFSIYPSINDKVEGICHNVDFSVLPAFLKKEGLFVPNNPNYKLIRVHVLDEYAEVLTLIGLKPNPILFLDQGKIETTLDYLAKSIAGAIEFSVAHEDMIELKAVLSEMKAKK